MSNQFEGGVKPKRQDTADDLVEAALNRGRKVKTETRQATKERETPKKFAAIKDNVFYRIIFAEGDPEAKKEAVANALAYDLTADRAQNKERLAQFEQLKEWLMEQRKQMAQEIINLTDTDAFSELKSVFDELNQGLLDFEKQMSPLTEILDAVYALRMASDGTMFEIFREIQEDRAEEQRIAELRAEQEAALERQQAEVTRMEDDIERLKQQRSWFGLGGIKRSAQLAITDRQQKLRRAHGEIEKLTSDIENTVVERVSKFTEYSEEKRKVRELLDISSDEHRARQQTLVDAANNFVNTADTRTSAVLEHLEGINTQIDRLGDSNGGLRGVYAIISEAVEDAEATNTQVRDSLLEAPQGESNIAQMKRENNKMAVEDHVTTLTNAKVDTMATFGDLTAESYRIKSMKDANNSQVAKTRSLNSKGVSGVASRLSTVLQGVSMAALTESSEVAQMTLERMNDETNKIAQKEALKNAMGIQMENDALVKAIQELESYGKVARAATDISREGYQEMKGHLAELEKTAREVGEAVKDAVAVGAEVMQGKTPAQKAAATASEDGGPDDADPFSQVKI